MGHRWQVMLGWLSCVEWSRALRPQGLGVLASVTEAAVESVHLGAPLLLVMLWMHKRNCMILNDVVDYISPPINNNNNINRHLYSTFARGYKTLLPAYHYGVRKIVTIILLHPKVLLANAIPTSSEFPFKIVYHIKMKISQCLFHESASLWANEHSCTHSEIRHVF